MKQFYFYVVPSELPDDLRLGSIEFDPAGKPFGAIYDEIAGLSHLPRGPVLDEESIKTAFNSFPETELPLAQGDEIPFWGLNFNSLIFEFLGHYAAFDAVAFEEQTEEVYAAYLNLSDLRSVAKDARILGLL